MSNTIISDIESLKILRELEQSKKELTELEGIINAAVESYPTESSWNSPHCIDSSSVTYSIDKKRLLDIPTNKKIYSVKKGTELILGFKHRKYDNYTKILESLILPATDNYDNYDSQNPRPHLQQKRHELFHIYI